jgi:gamma-glutamylcyclotransferase
MPRQSAKPLDVYFAYGSNMDRAQMRARCPKSKYVGWGHLNGYRLAYVGHSQRWGGGVATVIPHKGDRVAGFLYFVTPDDLKSLDRYEGVPRVYDRKIVTVRLGDEPLSVKAVTYYHVQGLSERPPSPSYLRVIQDAHAWMLRQPR